MLMRDEKEGRKKQARSYKKQGKAIQHTQGSHFYIIVPANGFYCDLYTLVHKGSVSSMSRYIL